jgi:branched-chain amino acid transport system permease protein
MLDTTFLIQILISGLTIGSIYALMSAGLTIIYGVMDIIHAAHGEYLMMAMYISFFANSLFGMDPYLSLLLTVPITFGVGIIIFYGLILPVVNEPPAYPMLITIGISIVLQNLALYLFTADFRMVTLPYFSIKFKYGLLAITIGELIAFAGALAISLGFYWFLLKTDLGRRIRASAEDREGALLMGINVRRIQAISFGLGTACLGITGPLLMPIYYINPTVGDLFLLRAFVIVVFGGMGNFIGALVGGMVIGISEVIGTIILPGSLAPIVSFTIFIGFLLFKPEGLFGAKK